jgi:hypothetical protein
MVKGVMNEVRWWWGFLVCLCMYICVIFIVLQKASLIILLLLHGYCKIA